MRAKFRKPKATRPRNSTATIATHANTYIDPGGPRRHLQYVLKKVEVGWRPPTPWWEFVLSNEDYMSITNEGSGKTLTNGHDYDATNEIFVLRTLPSSHLSFLTKLSAAITEQLNALHRPYPARPPGLNNIEPSLNTNANTLVLPSWSGLLTALQTTRSPPLVFRHQENLTLVVDILYSENRYIADSLAAEYLRLAHTVLFFNLELKSDTRSDSNGAGDNGARQSNSQRTGMLCYTLYRRGGEQELVCTGGKCVWCSGDEVTVAEDVRLRVGDLLPLTDWKEKGKGRGEDRDNGELEDGGVQLEVCDEVLGEEIVLPFWQMVQWLEEGVVDERGWTRT